MSFQLFQNEESDETAMGKVLDFKEQVKESCKMVSHQPALIVPIECRPTSVYSPRGFPSEIKFTAA